MTYKKIFTLFAIMLSTSMMAQDKKPFSISGTAGVSYEHYGLNSNPAGWSGFSPRKPWNQVRFMFAPEIKFGKNFSMPLNLNLSTKATNFAGPYSGIGKQTFAQYITNPMNSIGANPKYKWAELQLGTQYLNYSNLSTGDIGVFGAGFDLRPKDFLIKFFTGLSQQSVNFFTGPPSTTGAYKRKNWMVQIGKAKEGKYEATLNFVKAKDVLNSLITPPPTVKAQEGFTVSFLTKINFNEKWYFNFEGAHSYYTKDLLQPLDSAGKSFKPFIDGHTSTVRDWAAESGVGRKTKNFDVAAKVKYVGAGFQTPGYPFLLPDRLDYTLNTRINAWKNKMNIVASIGQRVNNVKNTTLRAKQFIGNINWFTQFNDHWNLNVSFNNFGFQSASGINPYGIKNVSNDFGLNPSYTWSNEKVVHLVSLNYNYSKYDERDVFTAIVTSNNTHTVLLTYIPTFLTKEFTPDFSFMYFLNQLPGFKLKLITVSSGLSMPFAKKKANFRGQLQYNFSKTNAYKNNNNLITSCTVDWKLNKKLTWNNFISSNYFKYGDEVIPVGANYLESNIRTGLLYRFGK